MSRNIDELIRNMTLEEKASLCSGADLWHTKKVDRLEIPDIKLSDGPHGMRTQDDKSDNLGINESLEAVCFPPAALSACSFDRELIREEGKAIGKEAMAFHVSTVLGPAVNMKRSPLCGRNFEYYSEDPYLAGEIASAFVEGVQSEGVGTSVKHFAANNQETYRMSNDSIIDERTLREIYLSAFEKTVKQAKPTTLMCSYNRINGVYASENRWLLNDVLREEWGFDGLVMSDWNAVNDRPLGVHAGLDLEMPSSNGVNDREIVEAVESGKLDEKDLDKTVKRILTAIYRYQDNKRDVELDLDSDHELSRKIAESSMVLLKNEDNILPLSPREKILFVGEFFEKPRFQGGGSSHINSHLIVSAEDAMEGKELSYYYSKGFSSKRDELDEESFEMILSVAENMDKVVVFAGLPESFESEGYDRDHMRLPDSQNDMIDALLSANENVVVVLSNGSPVEMPWNDEVKGVLEGYLGGEASGEAVIKILYGEINPSGKLAETFPMYLEDNPSYLNFGERKETHYNEGVFIGYRYYDKKKMNVLYPFGHGLSYTKFVYSNLNIEKSAKNDRDVLYTISFDVTNSGYVEGSEVAQVYVGDNTGAAVRPEKELKGFEKITLKPQETKKVTIELFERDFEWYNTEIHDWYAKDGSYTIYVGSSSRDIRLEGEIELELKKELPFVVDFNTTIGELRMHEDKFKKAKKLVEAVEKVYGFASDEEDDEKNNKGMLNAMITVTPLRNIYMFGIMEKDAVSKEIEILNEN
ncbi:MAG: glycoside hydrolase family 3 C-terminal domain-containing protein [Lachnospiraceae bacterium]|nr:glycoside hydrolase family 3 C-terminal domain-containing protein [Lachnospiraceae bacterium]